MKTALILVDLIHEIVDSKGKLSGKGYTDFALRHETLLRIKDLLFQAREKDFLIIHVGLGFSGDYCEQPKNSPLFGAAQKYGALQTGTWACDFIDHANPLDGEVVLTKHRVSAFFGTPLDIILHNNSIECVVVVGCATDMAVQATVRDAHDRDYQVTVIGDCCIAANDEDHDQTLRMLQKISNVIHLDDFKG
jgi:nicotinamidase-related amidase